MRALDLLENSLTELIDFKMDERDLETLDDFRKLLNLYKNTVEEKRSKVFYDLLDLEFNEMEALKNGK
jgi:hypothetical protein